MLDDLKEDFAKIEGYCYHAFHLRDSLLRIKTALAEAQKPSPNNARGEIFTPCLDCELSGYGKRICRKCVKTSPIDVVRKVLLWL